jgi:acyl carrier protein
MEISENELWILSYYRESELEGALVMGRLARETGDDDLRVRLTAHCAEEAEHAWLWTRTIIEVGGTARRVRETYQDRYLAAVGQPAGVLEVLALTHVFERRVVRHFRRHLARPDTHPAVAATLRRMIDDEAGHLGWVKGRLDQYRGTSEGARVADLVRRYVAADRRVYAELLAYHDRFAEVVAPASGEVAARDGALAARVRRVLARSLGMSERDLPPDAALRDLGADSLDLTSTLMALEDAFRIEFRPSDADGLVTVGDLIDRVSALVRAR